ncbi:hypothetical protein F7725_021766 [Dissostichus mawsoni]|uniref:Strictosidine synthase conserved region domain-containing protein n=1 Tax=Dissostichus mawsoni TaxID=36200 RepID=A0A7J5ZFG6_DISMA|nr:hypothetical protein F7725_021766 [Dissostichus mawsoni]
MSKRSLLAALLSVAVGVYLLPSPIDPKPHVLKGPPPALEGPLAVNTLLQKGRRLFVGKLHGPESFTADEEGNVFTGTVDGKLWRIAPDDSLTLLTHMGQDLPECGSSTDYEPVCGRPHGVRLDRAAGVPFSFLNGLEISSQTGIIYFTDSSSRWGRRHVTLEVIELNSLGRLLSFDPQTGSVTVLLGDLYMPNGIALDHGTFLVGITTPRFRKITPPFLDMIAPYPAVKRFLAKVIPLSWYRVLLPRYALVLELGSDGGLVGSLQDPEARLTWAISDVFQHRGRTYLGSTTCPSCPSWRGGTSDDGQLMTET